MIMIDPGGCQVPVEGVDTINVYGVKANFGYDGLPRCDIGLIQFSDSSVINDASATYAWNFGDGGVSVLQNPSHLYAAAGQYNPQLIVTTNRMFRHSQFAITSSDCCLPSGRFHKCVKRMYTGFGNLQCHTECA